MITDVAGGFDFAGAGALQPDGKLLVAGSAVVPGVGSRAAVVRYLPNGQLDPTFGTGGIVTTGLANALATQAVGVVPIADGRIVIAVRSFGGTNFTWGAIRLDASGARDATFGTGGETQVTFGPGFDVLNALAVTPTGKIVLAGGTNSGSDAAFIVVRLNSDGSLDPTFGTSGRVRTPFGGFFALITEAELQPDGRLVVGGMHGTTDGSTWAFARYLTDGSLDMTFGSSGIAKVSFGPFAESSGLALTPDSKIVAAGSAVVDAATFETGYAFARLNSDGSLDESFGVRGKTVGRGGFLSSVVLAPDGSAIGAGSTFGSNRDFFVVALDPGGGVGTTTQTDFGTVFDVATDIVATSGGRHVAIGAANGDFALAAYTFSVDASPPRVVPIVEGVVGNGGWYRSDVEVSWSIVDEESPVTSASGCEPRRVDTDTRGQTLTCTATSAGGATTVSVTVKRDATPPTLTCVASPNEIWPPTHRLESIQIDVVIDDVTSGGGPFALTSIDAGSGDPQDDLDEWELGASDTSGLVRAERDGAAARTYAFVYTGSDVAGNTSACRATVSIPHDRRPVEQP